MNTSTEELIAIMREADETGVFTQTYDRAEFMVKTADMLRAARLDAGLTQAALAKRLGKRYWAIARCERAINGSIRISLIYDWLKACDCKLLFVVMKEDKQGEAVDE